MSDIRCLEHPTLKVPYELLNKRFRAAQKTMDREVSHVQATVQDFNKGLENKTVGAKEVSKIIGGMVERIKSFKRKATDSIAEELQMGVLCKRRLEHLKQPLTEDYNSPVATSWRRTRLDRMLVEHMLRLGFYDTATKLALKYNLDNYTNLAVFLLSKEVETSLQERETSICITWCHDNKSKLRKLKSTMEFNLRLQEFVELVRSDRRVDAVKHARKYLSCCEREQMPEVEHVMALLALPVTTQLSPYKELLSPKRWDSLINQFRQENFKLFQLPQTSPFNKTLEAGLSSLKTSQCYSNMKELRNASCPVCQEKLNLLAETLPYAHCSQSRLVCAASGKPLNEHNTPLILPNGHVYGEVALTQMAAENNGHILCPKTKEIFSFEKVEKVYVM